jgi:HEAT repeat protein
MRRGYRCALIGGVLLVALGAFAGEPADTSGTDLTLEQKLARAHELVGVRDFAAIQEMLKLIHEVGVGNFLEPYESDEAKLCGVVEQVMFGSSTEETSMTRADVATYLLKDKRAKVRDLAIKHITRLALYCDKPYVSGALYDIYQGAKDDADLRLRVAHAFGLVSTVDRQGREPKERPPLTGADRDKICKDLQAMLRDPDPRVRRTVVENMSRDPITMQGSGVGILENDPNPGVRAAVIDYYREVRVKTDRVQAMVIRALGHNNVEELEKAVEYCAAMKLDEAREPMLAVIKRYAEDTGGDGGGNRTEKLKLRIVDLALELKWNEATPDLLWTVENDADWKVRNRAAYAVLRLAGQETVQLGTMNVVFAPSMVEAEAPAMMLAFKAWVIAHHEEKGETPEVKQLQEEAQIEFSDKVYKIAEQLLFDPDVANKRRGLRLVMDIGPEEFAKEINTVEEMNHLFGSLQVFMHMREDLEANRQTARLVLAFVTDKDKSMVMLALRGLEQLAPFCDGDVFMPVLSKLLNTPDPEIVEAARRAGNAIQARGYSGRLEQKQGKRRYQEGPSKPEGK